MKRYLFAGVLALAGFAGTADAQYVYGYNTVNPYTGSVVSGSTVYTPFATQATYGYYNPYTGMTGQRVMYQNAWGTSMNRAYGYNPYYGGGYASGYYNPGFGMSPYYGGGYRYRW